MKLYQILSANLKEEKEELKGIDENGQFLALYKLSVCQNTSINKLLKENTHAPVKEIIFPTEELINKISEITKKDHLPMSEVSLSIAIQAHEGRFRKGNGKVPYIQHPLTMAFQALMMGIRDDEIITSCLLHDVPEDTETKTEDLPVSERVKEILTLLTYHPRADRMNAIREYYEGIRTDKKACLVKCLDRINNLAGSSYGMKEERVTSYIDESETFVIPLLDIIKDEYENSSYLMRYELNFLINTYKHYI